jgi:hypothetical protein
VNTKVRIELVEDPPGLRPPVVRLRCLCWLSTPLEDPRGRLALIDTGAPFSIVPLGLWRGATGLVEPAGADVTPNCRTIRGVSGGSMPCEFGWLYLILADVRGSFSDWLRVPAKLAMTNEVPLVLGVAGFLDTYEVALNRDGESYVVLPGAG